MPPFAAVKIGNASTNLYFIGVMRHFEVVEQLNKLRMAKQMNKYEKRRYDFLLAAEKEVEKKKLIDKDKKDLIQIKLPLS